jgi:hypothetical protein
VSAPDTPTPAPPSRYHRQCPICWAHSPDDGLFSEDMASIAGAGGTGAQGLLRCLKCDHLVHHFWLLDMYLGAGGVVVASVWVADAANIPPEDPLAPGVRWAEFYLDYLARCDIMKGMERGSLSWST